MGIVFKANNKMIYAFPITSIGQNQNLRNAYHPIDNPNGNNIFYKMKASDFSFLELDSAIKTRELKCISVKRIIAKCGSVKTNKPLTDELTNISFDFLFHEKANEIKRLKKQKSLLKMTIEASKILDVYEISAITDLSDLIDVDTTTYSFLIGTPILKDSMQYEVEIKLTDKYNQEISKIIRYNLIEV